MKNTGVCGEFPEFCYKAFKEREQAEQFVNNGTMRLGCIRYYRNIEDPRRRDPTEGIGCTKEPGVVTQGLVSPNPATKTIWTRNPGHKTHHTEFLGGVFCLCMFLPDVELNRMRNLGEFVVRIGDTRRLAEDVNDYLCRQGQKFVIKGCNVTYNKGEQLDRELTINERLDLSYSQKPPSYVDEHEFRIVALRLGTPCNEDCKYLSGQFEQVEPDCAFLGVNIGRPLEYVQALEPRR